MAGTYDDDCATKLVKCHDRMMIVKKDTMEYLGNHSYGFRPFEHIDIVDAFYELMPFELVEKSSEILVNEFPDIKEFEDTKERIEKI